MEGGLRLPVVVVVVVGVGLLSVGVGDGEGPGLSSTPTDRGAGDSVALLAARAAGDGLGPAVVIGGEAHCLATS